MTKLTGIFAALPTPFDWRGDLYTIKIHHNLARWNRVVGLAGYVVCGRAGEANELTRDEKQQLMAAVKQSAAEGRMLIAGVGSESLRNGIALTKAAAELGYQAVLAEPVGREASVDYYRALADQSALPVIIAGADPEVAAAASRHPNITAVLTNDSVALTGQLPEGVSVFAASATNLAEALRAGASGAMLAYAAAVPYSCVTIWEANLKREYEAATDWQTRIRAAAELVESGPANLKHALDVNGYYGGNPRLPLTAITQERKVRVEAALEGLVQRA